MFKGKNHCFKALSPPAVFVSRPVLTVYVQYSTNSAYENERKMRKMNFAYLKAILYYCTNKDYVFFV